MWSNAQLIAIPTGINTAKLASLVGFVAKHLTAGAQSNDMAFLCASVHCHWLVEIISSFDWFKWVTWPGRGNFLRSQRRLVDEA